MRHEEDMQLARDVARALNTFGFGYKDFCEAMSREHRTLQQSFTRLCLEWLRTCANMEYYDGRNEASVEVGKIVVDALDAHDIHSVPMV